MARAVLFDVDGVLVHGYHARPERQIRWDENLLKDLGIDPDRFREEFIFDIFVKKVVVGKMALVEALERRLPALGYAGSPVVFAQYWLSRDSNVDRDLVAIVRRLAAHPEMRLFIATNQDHMRAQWLWQTLGFGEVFEDIFYSARVGAAKPHRSFFDFAAARIGNAAEPPLFFDDAEQNVEAARALGWEAVLYEGIEDVTDHPWIASRLAGIPGTSADASVRAGPA